MKKLVTLIFLLAASLSSYAQTRNMYFDHLGIKQGLPEKHGMGC